MKRVLYLIGVIFFISCSQPEIRKQAKIKTAYGDITIQLFNETPKHRDNFLQLIENKSNKYSFQRVVKNFIIQGGNLDTTLTTELNSEIVYPQFFHRRGVIVAARKNDEVNSDRKSSANQFFIVVGRTYTDKELDAIEKHHQELVNQSVNDNKILSNFRFTPEQREIYKTFGGTPELDGRYSIFGEVIDGYDVMDELMESSSSEKIEIPFTLEFVE